ncbi:MAG TPA: hypothetical protein VG328_00705 [Stellaceae bacterium]|jgi:hypothetical protein|nr:hypothetical protein [Stellaceae bacterium]
MRSGRLACVLAAVLCLIGCTARFDVTPSPDNESAYSLLYPFYVELCAVSQIKKKPGVGVDTSGGPGGHTVFFLSRVCRDQNAHYPTLVMCSPGTPEDEQGVGLSVNAHFQNANWVATEGRGFFFNGDLKPGERVTRAAYERTQKTAEAKNIYDGIVFHDEVFEDQPRGMNRHDFMYEVSVATDYAVGLARDRYCGRVPVSRAQMVKIVDYLNGENAPYRNGKEFVWNVLENNCTHLAHNALAAADVWDKWPIDRFLLISAFDFPVPKNEFVNIMRRTNDMDLADWSALYADDTVRRSLEQDGNLPTEPGALAEAVRADQDNDIYNTDVNLIFYDDPITDRYRRRFAAIFAEPRYTDLRANLAYFATLYAEVKDELASAPKPSDSGLAAFKTRYARYIDREAADIDTKMQTLNRMPAIATSPPRARGM